MKDLRERCEKFHDAGHLYSTGSIVALESFAREIRNEGWHEGMGYAAAIAEQNGPADCNCEDKILAAALAVVASDQKEVDKD